MSLILPPIEWRDITHMIYFRLKFEIIRRTSLNPQPCVIQFLEMSLYIDNCIFDELLKQ